jgi:hypothetical protein
VSQGRKDHLITENYTVLDEKIISDPYGILTPINYFLFDALNDKVVRLAESGIFDKIMKEKPTNSSYKEPIALKLSHLSIWFYLGMSFLLISSLVFFGEVLVEKILKFRKQKMPKISKRPKKIKSQTRKRKRKPDVLMT